MPDTSVERCASPGRSNARTRGFSNCRDWRSFLAAAQPTAYTSVATALKAGHAWLTGHGWAYGWLADRGRETCNSLLGEGGLVSGTRKTIGV
jgi:hypothetical protein